MPELPEVETIARQLNSVLVGQRIEGVEVRHKKSFQGSVKQVIGKKIDSVGRRAKVLIIDLSGKLKLLIHLKMTGQLIYDENDQISNSKKQTKRVVGGHPTTDWVNELPSKHTRVVFKLSKGILFFNDMRIFGWVKVMNKREMEKELEKYGLDVNDRKLTETMFYQILKRSGRAVKLVIIDQAKIAGVGNIYANEGLWCAKVNPKRQAKSLKQEEAKRLLLCLRKVIAAGIKYGGATASDENFVNAKGLGGKYQEHFLVYEQGGKKCGRKGCDGVIKKVKLGGRGTYYCPKCQH